MENENTIKEEAKRLIAKTKKMIETMDTTKTVKTSDSKKGSFINTRSNPIISERNNNFQSLRIASPQFDSPSFSPSRPENTLPYDKNWINVNLWDSKLDLKLQIKNMSIKIGEMSVYIKSLEKQLKEKDEYIATTQTKLHRSNEIINSWNSTITNERNNNAKVENSNMKRKIAALEKKWNDNTYWYEEIIKEYKEKLEKISSEHVDKVNVLNKIKEDTSALSFDNQKMQNEINLKEETIQNYVKLSDEKDFNEKVYIRKIEKWEDNLRIVCSMVRKWYKAECTNYYERNEMFGKMKVIFK